jgi:hypothetical protein
MAGRILKVIGGDNSIIKSNDSRIVNMKKRQVISFFVFLAVVALVLIGLFLTRYLAKLM